MAVPEGIKFVGIDGSIPTPELNGKRVNDKSGYYSIEEIAAAAGVGSQGPQGVEGPAGPPGPVGPAGLTWQGQWANNAGYSVNDAVGYNGASWFCIDEITAPIAPSVNLSPDEDTEHWALLASQGAVGPQGAQGPTGPQGPSGTDSSKVYIASLNQSVTANLVSTVYKNTAGFLGSFTRLDVGSYAIEIPPTYTAGKVVISLNLGLSAYSAYTFFDGTYIQILCLDGVYGSGAPTDDALFNATIKIELFD